MPSAMSDAAESLRQVLAVIERELGTDWLLWNSGDRKRRGPGSQEAHPVAVAWAEARKLLEQLKAGASVSLENRPNLALLDELATDLQSAQNIPNFAKANRPRLKTTEFEKAQFEMHVGALYQRSGQRVEFVPTERRRRADLKVTVEGHDVFVECTRKDSYTPDRYDDSAARESLARDILALQTQLSAALEVVVVVPGALDPPHLSADVLKGIRTRIENGDRGSWTRAADGLGFVIRELTPILPPPGGGVGVAIPASILSPKRLALSEGTYAVDAKGQPYIAGEKRAAVYTIDSHRMSSVIDSLRRKLGQIPKDSSGLVYMNLDVSHVAEGDVDLYMQSAQNAVHAALTTPPGNPQIGAVILMTSPIPLALKLEDGTVVRVLGRKSFLVRNPDGASPQGLIIPGAPPTPESKPVA
jgi:hypothetical protein